MSVIVTVTVRSLSTKIAQVAASLARASARVWEALTHKAKTHGRPDTFGCMTDRDTAAVQHDSDERARRVSYPAGIT
jgi:hypothetical protein